jgi:hypothetical protein
LPTITEQIVIAQQDRMEASARLRSALRTGRDFGLSWSQLAAMTGMSIGGVRWLVEYDPATKQKGEK